jgi:tetratricopeptide (TPR) repeat protein
MFRVLLAAMAAGAAALCASDPASKAFDHFYNLEYEEAISIFRELAAENPSDPAARNHLAQAILFRVMYRSGALESEMVTGTNPFVRRAKMEPTAHEREEFLEQVEASLRLTRDRLKEDPRDAGALYAQGVAYGLRANFNLLVRKAWIDSLQDATAARKAHAKVTSLRPGDVDAQLVQGLHEYILGNLPFALRILGFVTGSRGDKEGGIRTLELVAREGVANKVDAQILLGLIYRREKQSELAVPMIRKLIGLYPRNYLFRLELAQMYSDAGDGEQALEVLDQLEALKRLRPRRFDRLPYERIWFARGVVQFWYRNYAAAEENLKHAAERADVLDLNTALMAWMRLGQTYDCMGEREKAITAYRSAVALAPEADIAKTCRGYIRKPFRRTD